MPFAIDAGQYEATYFSIKSDLISAQRKEKIKGAVNIHQWERCPDILSWQYRLNMAKCESILWLPRKLKKKKFYSANRLKYMHLFSPGNFTTDFITFLLILSVGLLFHRNFISKCLPGRWWTPTAQLLLLGRIARLPLSLAFSGLQTKIPAPPLSSWKARRSFPQLGGCFQVTRPCHS